MQNAQDDLKDTEYEKFISDTETMLDDLFNDYETFIDDKINNTDTLLTDIKGLLGDEGSIVATLKALDPNLTQTLENTVNGNTNAQDYTNNEVANEQNNAEQPVDNSGYDAEAEAKKQAEEAQKEKERQENERKRNMLLSQIKIIQDDIIEMENELQRLAEEEKEEEKEYAKAKKDKKNKGKVFAKTDWALLRKVINGRLAARKQELKDFNSELASIPQYEKGSSHISKKQLAWTQENGNEMIYRALDGAMLTPLGTGDKAFTNEMSERLWKMAQMNPLPLNIPNNIPTTVPILERDIGSVGDVNISFGDLTLPNVTNSAEFVDSVENVMRNAVCKNGKTLQCMTEGISAKIMGKSIGNARLYRN